MVSLATLLLGPLAGPEFRRAVGRGWMILARTLTGLALMSVALVAFWSWWISQQVDPLYRPYHEFRIGLATVEWMAVTIALVMCPALLAGTLAGEKERGVMGLLLTTRVGAREIVVGRLTGRLSQVAMILLAGLPGLVLVASMAGMSPTTFAAILGLPAAVALGGGGIAVAASAVSRRGVQALLAVYLLDLLLLLAPLTVTSGLTTSVGGGIASLNPFYGLNDLIFREDPASSLVSMGLWSMIGLGGVALASWRLRPSCLGSADGERRLRRRRKPVPPVDDNPMLWKELYIERVAHLGWFGKWLGILLVVGLAGGSAIPAAIYAWAVWFGNDPGLATFSLTLLDIVIGGPGMLVCLLIQWVIGLRGAVAIASERERGTWDALLTSPLEGSEIIRGKLWGALYALRWLVASAWFAWTLALACGAIPLGQYLSWMVDTVVIGAFMAAVGVRASLSASTAARAMAMTIGTWLAAQAVVRVVAAGVLLFLALWMFIAWGVAVQLGLVTSMWPLPTWAPAARIAWPLATSAIYVLATVSLAGEQGLRFDRIAGRMAGGKVAVAVDRTLHGRPTAPVGLDPREVPG